MTTATSASLDARHRLAIIVETMREISRQTDPQVISRIYGQRMRQLMPFDRFMALSRRDLSRPQFRITRSSLWTEEVNPWKERDRLPLLSGGLLAELIWGDEPRIIDDLAAAVSPDDPAAEYLAGMGSLTAIPHYDRGAALNMVVVMRAEPAAFDPEELPQMVWVNNLYGRATSNLVQAEQVKTAYEAVDREMQTVAALQRSLLPDPLPTIPTMALAAHYQTSQRAGGDYYDFFPLPDGKWGILIADVSGHGTAAAVLMAVTHTIAHTYPGPPTPPGEMLKHVNRVLAGRYTTNMGAFVTAFYAVYDPATRTIAHASAGHPPPRLKRCSDGSLALLDGKHGLPLGILPDEEYPEGRYELVPGDQIVFYTDGVTEAESPAGEPFGLTRLDAVLANCAVGAGDLLKEVLRELESFTAGKPPADDRTVLVAKIS
ncbi:MAG TPA: PP2C family protein-serine/threonine phosphatase [Gemmataceae bacterium]